ncbi:MAG: phosphoribosylglycinamide formyltransferase 1 [Solirubrobacterales bacterium]|jgi:phosphoribosylglycinamide formyltransferase-1|nr:phosphoribosylglycinamide formyltransferase 1 [Solirubrobacterales bacterium]
MSEFRLAVLASGTGSNLQAILDRLHGRDGIEVVAVASNRPDATALERAQTAGVETAVFERSEFADRSARDIAIADWLEQRSVDLVVLAGYMELLSAEFVARFRGRIVNVHPALLPAFPGIDAIEQALAHGARMIGVTVHFVDEGVDSGPIILQRAIDVPYTRDVEEVEQLIHPIEHELLPRAIRLIAAGAVRIDDENPRLVRIDEHADV